MIPQMLRTKPTVDTVGPQNGIVYLIRAVFFLLTSAMVGHFPLSRLLLQSIPEMEQPHLRSVPLQNHGDIAHMSNIVDIFRPMSMFFRSHCQNPRPILNHDN